MKWPNYTIGAIGVTSLIASVVLHFYPMEKIGLKEGSAYYYEPSHGYGIHVSVKPQAYTAPQFTAPMYQIIFFEDNVENAHAFFSPVVINADKDSFSLSTRTTDELDSGFSAFYSRKENEMSSATVYKKFPDRSERYTDLDGDFLSDRRYTTYNNKKRKVEEIIYNFREMEIEPVDADNPVSPPENSKNQLDD